jgi:pilus assembly protein CpaE
MANRPLLLAVRANPELVTLLERVAGSQGLGVGKISQYLTNGSRIDLSQLSPDAPCIAFIDFTDVEQGIRTAEALSANATPRIWPVAVSLTSDNDTLLRAMRAGCSEFLRWPATDSQIDSALGNVLRRVAAIENESSRNGRLVAFIGVRGGVGATTLAVHTSLALAGLPDKNILLVDLKRQLGHVAVYLNLTNSGYSFSTILGDIHRLDGALLHSMLVRHATGLSVLCSPDDCSSLSDAMRRQHFRSEPPTVEAIDRVLALLRAESDFTIFDADPALPETAAIAQRADQVFLVSSLDIASMRDVSRYLDMLGRNQDRQKLIITRAGRGPLTLEMMANSAGIPFATTFPDLAEPISAAINAGHQVPQQVHGFHDSLNVVLGLIDQEAVPAPRKGSFFGIKR